MSLLLHFTGSLSLLRHFIRTQDFIEYRHDIPTVQMDTPVVRQMMNRCRQGMQISNRWDADKI